MKYKICLSLLLLGVAGCNLVSPNAFVDLGIQITVTSASGTDLLDPNNPHAFRKEEITFYEFKDGEFVEFYLPNLDNPKGFHITQNQDGVYQLNLAAGPTEDFTDTQLVTAKIQWSETDVDTLEYQIEEKRNGGYQSITHVWVNDELAWPYEGAMGRTIHIVKESLE